MICHNIGHSSLVVSVVFVDVMNRHIFILRFGIKQTNISGYRSARLWLLALKNTIIVLLQMIFSCFDIVMHTLCVLFDN